MVEYNCNWCGYNTIIKTHYLKHLKTKKHLWNEKEQENKKKENESKMNPIESKMNPNESLKKYICQFCNKSYSTNSNLHKHLKKCSKYIQHQKEEFKNESKNESKNVTQMLPKCYQMLPKCYPNVTQDDSKTKKNECPFCFKIFATRHGKSRHLKTCKVKKEEDEKEKNNNMQLEILKKIDEKLTNNENKGTMINTQNNNYNTINYLNLNFQNMQTIEDFLENLKNKYQLSITDRKCLLDTFNECGIDAFAETFSIIMKKYQSEQVEQGLLPTMPIVCTDGNLRSMKEYHENGWKSTQSNSSIDKMINISNDQIYASENTMVYISTKDRKKIYNRIKQDNSLVNLEEIKKNYIAKIKLEEKSEEYKSEESDEEYKSEESEEEDFSIINDEYIEKYSKL